MGGKKKRKRKNQKPKKQNEQKKTDIIEEEVESKTVSVPEQNISEAGNVQSQVQNTEKPKTKRTVEIVDDRKSHRTVEPPSGQNVNPDRNQETKSQQASEPKVASFKLNPNTPAFIP